MEKVTFYREWLSLPKAEFNVLTLIAEQGGTFTGNWSDMCRYINLTPQNRNRKVLQAAVESLHLGAHIRTANRCYIHYNERGRRFCLCRTAYIKRIGNGSVSYAEK